MDHTGREWNGSTPRMDQVWQEEPASRRLQDVKVSYHNIMLGGFVSGTEEQSNSARSKTAETGGLVNILDSPRGLH
jgi:hypothetical protein